MNKLNNTFQNILSIKTNCEISNIIILKDGRISISLNNGYIKIYKKYEYSLDLSIQVLFGFGIYYHTQLENENIITCNYDKKMSIIKLNNKSFQKLQVLHGHKDKVLKVIEIKDNKLISSSLDGKIKLWNLTDKNKYKCINTIGLSEKNNYLIPILTKDNEFLCSTGENETIKFFKITSKNINLIHIIKNIKCSCGSNSIIKINDIVLVGGNNFNIYIININNHELISILNNEINNIDSIMQLSNGNILIGGNIGIWNNEIIEYKLNNNNLIKIRNSIYAHQQTITGLSELNDKNKSVIISCGWDMIIQFWN